MSTTSARRRAEQVAQLREAFATLSDVLVEEIDALRNDAAQRWELAEAHLNRHAQSLRALRAEIALVRDEMQTAQHGAQARAQEAAEREGALGAQLAQLSHEVAASNSAQHLLQLELVEHKAAAERMAQQLDERFTRVQHALDGVDQRALEQRAETETALAALDQDINGAKDMVGHARHDGASAADAHKEKLLQCAQAIEKQWVHGKELSQRIEAVVGTQSLLQQQLQERLESGSKQQTRWKAAIDDALRTSASDVEALRAAMGRYNADSLLDGQKAELRRMLDDRDDATKRQLDALSRAIHSLAESVNVASPLALAGR